MMAAMMRMPSITAAIIMGLFIYALYHNWESWRKVDHTRFLLDCYLKC